MQSPDGIYPSFPTWPRYQNWVTYKPKSLIIWIICFASIAFHFLYFLHRVRLTSYPLSNFLDYIQWNMSACVSCNMWVKAYSLLLSCSQWLINNAKWPYFMGILILCFLEWVNAWSQKFIHIYMNCKIGLKVEVMLLLILLIWLWIFQFHLQHSICHIAAFAFNFVFYLLMMICL